MKKMNYKIIIPSIFLFLAISLAGLAYYASTLITPEEIRRVAVEQLQMAFPKSKIEIGKLNLRFGFSTRLEIETFSIKPLEGEKTLVSVENFFVRIPLWSIITGGGTIEVSLTSPMVHYEDLTGLSNWDKARDVIPSKKKAAPKASESASNENTNQELKTEDLIIPAFIANSVVDLKVKDLKLSYALKDSAGDFVISRLIFKNVSLKAASGFEIDSKFNLDLASGEKVSFSTLVIGEFRLEQLLQKEDFTIASMIKIENLSAPGIVNPIKEIKIDTNLSVSPTGSVKGNLRGGFDRTNFAFSIQSDEKGMALTDLNLNAQIEDLLGYINMKMPDLNASRSVFSLSGSVNQSPEGRLNQNLNFKLDPALTYSLEGNPLQVSLDGRFVDKNLSTTVNVEAFGGTILTRLNGELDLNDKNLSIETLKPFAIALSLNNLKMSKDSIQKILYSPAPPVTAKTSDANSETVGSANKAKDDQKPAAPIFLPRSRIDINVNHVFVDTFDLTGDGVVIVGKDSVVTERFKINYSQGEGNLTHSTKLVGEKLDNQFEFKMKNLNMEGLNAFLPPMVKGIKGIFSGDFKGKVLLDGKLPPSYQVNVSVNATKGEIVGLNLSEQINQFVASVPMLAGKLPEGRAYEFDSNFETLSVRGLFTDKKYDLTSFEFIGLDKKVELKGSGPVFPPPSRETSDLKLTIVDKSGKISKQLEQAIGTNILPVRMTGPGFELKPDLQYTLGRVAKSAFETKAKTKVESEAKKQIETLKDKGREELNRFLKRK